jgi:hypothetical protein
VNDCPENVPVKAELLTGADIVWGCGGGCEHDPATGDQSQANGPQIETGKHSFFSNI